MIQHDTSLHKWSPLVENKWYLITSIDDHSRLMLYGDLWEKETSWSHIVAIESVVAQFGCPLRYYVDNHTIFRFIERRDSLHRKASIAEEEAKVQWKEVLKDLGIEVEYANSPQAKGKIERPYRWLQDHMVRTCIREKITKIEDARQILYEEIHRYNYRLCIQQQKKYLLFVMKKHSKKSEHYLDDLKLKGLLSNEKISFVTVQLV